VIGQRVLLAIALVCGAIAGTIYYASLQRVTVVVAAHALDADRPIAADDLTTAALPPDAVPAGALVPPAGQRAIAIPVTPSLAIGGALAAGAHVDVIAVPVVGRAPAGRTTEIVAANATVLDVRGENGGPFVLPGTSRSGAASGDRLGSVVVALAPSDELRVADRVATSTFVLVFIPVRE